MAKYFFIPYEYGAPSGRPTTHGVIIREKQLDNLMAALNGQAARGHAPLELVAALERHDGSSVKKGGGGYSVIGANGKKLWSFKYGTPVGRNTFAETIAEARKAGVTAPHLYRVDVHGGLQPIAFGAKESGKRRKNTHDPVASTKAMITSLWHGVHSYGYAVEAKRTNDRRAAVGTCEWDFAQAWTHGEYSSLSNQDRADARTYIYELGMHVHELIADDQQPTQEDLALMIQNANRLTEFVAPAMRAANPRKRRKK